MNSEDYDNAYDGVIDYDYLMAMQDEALQELLLEEELEQEEEVA
jgi:hypothetical protein